MAARLKAAGAHVTAIGRHAVEHLAADEFVPADITTVEGTDKVIEQMAGNGGVDIIVHVAGGGASAPSGGFATLTPELWHHTLQLNLLGAVRVDRGLIPAMIQAGAGSIVHITSIQRKMPLYDATLAYAAAKAALTTYSKGLANTMDSLGGIPLGRPAHPKTSPNSSPSWSPTAPQRSQAPNTSSTAERSQPSKPSQAPPTRPLPPRESRSSSTASATTANQNAPCNGECRRRPETSWLRVPKSTDSTVYAFVTLTGPSGHQWARRPPLRRGACPAHTIG